MKSYQTKAGKIPGTNYSELIKAARLIFHTIEKRSKRRPYIRSAYFDKEKIFFDYFWVHLEGKSYRDRTRRLKYFSCALELIENSRAAPISKVSQERKDEILHRFTGISREGDVFLVQIKEKILNGQKYLLSLFPPE